MPRGSSTSDIGDTTTAVVARELYGFLDTHLLARDAENSSGILADQQTGGYSVEMYDPALGGESPAAKEESD